MFTIIKIGMTIRAIGRAPRIPLNAYATESPKPPLHDGQYSRDLVRPLGLLLGRCSF